MRKSKWLRGMLDTIKTTANYQLRSHTNLISEAAYRKIHANNTQLHDLYFVLWMCICSAHLLQVKRKVKQAG